MALEHDSKDPPILGAGVFGGHTLNRRDRIDLFFTTLGEAAEILRIGTIVAGVGQVSGIAGRRQNCDSIVSFLACLPRWKRKKSKHTMEPIN